MRRYAYLHVDVFTDKPFGGNPLSVFLDSQGLSADEMQSIAKEMNHSETTFLFPPSNGGAAKVRIFTPAVEIPFAGHPVIGTAFAIATHDPAKSRASMTLELAGGDVATTLELEDGVPTFVWMTQKPPERGASIADVDRLARSLGIGRGDISLGEGAAEVWSTGLPFLFVPLSGLTPMGRMRPNPQILHELLHEVSARGVYAITRETTRTGVAVRGRCFPIGVGVSEDAATGSAAGALAGYLLGHGWTGAGRIEVEQGIELGRPSSIHIDATSRTQPVRVGGRVVSVGRGEITI